MTIILPKNTAVATLCNSTLKLPIDMYSRLPNKHLIVYLFELGTIREGFEHPFLECSSMSLAFVGMFPQGCSSTW